MINYLPSLTDMKTFLCQSSMSIFRYNHYKTERGACTMSYNAKKIKQEYLKKFLTRLFSCPRMGQGNQKIEISIIFLSNSRTTYVFIYQK